MKHIVYSARGGSSSPSMIAIGDVIGMLDELTAGRSVVIVTDENLLASYGNIISKYKHIVIPGGEQHKNLATVEYIHRQLLSFEADRSSYLVGFGGGIVTDITGFAASTFMRGIGFGFVATSLLAQCDASVGGKNGVNLDGYKNIIGTFNQPDFVLCDQSLLTTLPARELRAGMSEALKCGIIGDIELFDIFVDNSYDQITNSAQLLTQIVIRSVEFKASIVAHDEREGGLRKLLNLGHTFGHAIEKCSHEYIHGEAVAIGIAIIGQLSTVLSQLSTDDYARIIRALKILSLPTEITSVSFDSLAQAAKSDKKRAGDSIELILIEQIGRCQIRKITIPELLNLSIK